MEVLDLEREVVKAEDVTLMWRVWKVILFNTAQEANWTSVFFGIDSWHKFIDKLVGKERWSLHTVAMFDTFLLHSISCLPEMSSSLTSLH